MGLTKRSVELFQILGNKRTDPTRPALVAVPADSGPVAAPAAARVAPAPPVAPAAPPLPTVLKASGPKAVPAAEPGPPAPAPSAAGSGPAAPRPGLSALLDGNREAFTQSVGTGARATVTSAPASTASTASPAAAVSAVTSVAMPMAPTTAAVTEADSAVIAALRQDDEPILIVDDLPEGGLVAPGPGPAIVTMAAAPAGPIVAKTAPLIVVPTAPMTPPPSPAPVPAQKPGARTRPQVQAAASPAPAQPPAASAPRPPFAARTVTLRKDTLIVAGALAFALAIASFMLGRASVSRSKEPAPSPAAGTQVAAILPGPVAPVAPSAPAPGPTAIPQAAAIEDDEEPERPAAAGPTAPPVASPGGPPTPTPSPAAAPAEPRWTLQVMRTNTTGANDVKRFLEERGYAVRLVRDPHGLFDVRVGAYGSKTTPEAKRDLAAIRALRYRDDSLAFKTAYFARLEEQR